MHFCAGWGVMIEWMRSYMREHDPEYNSFDHIYQVTGIGANTKCYSSENYADFFHNYIPTLTFIPVIVRKFNSKFEKFPSVFSNLN